MGYDPKRHHRRSIRLKGYDYSRAGAYFVTLVTRGRACMFGMVENGAMRLNALGKIARAVWLALPRHFPALTLDEWVIMPNHLHGLLILRGEPGAVSSVGAKHPPGNISRESDAMVADALPLRSQRRHPIGTMPGSVGAIVQNYKSITTRKINGLRHCSGVTIWQRNYYEHIVRDTASLSRIRHYIVNNPLHWELDRENPMLSRNETRGKTDEPWLV